MDDVRRLHEIQDDLDEFTGPMLTKLQENTFKGSYFSKDPRELLELLRAEVDELEFEIHSGSTTPSKIVHEAADVANFAMMIATVASDGWVPGWDLDGDV